MRILSACCVLLVGPVALAAQTACIEGKVLDTSGAPISDIHVIGTGRAQRASFDVTTDADGDFRISAIPAGDYGLATSDEYRSDLDDIDFTAAKFPLTAATAIADGCSSVTLRQPQRARIHVSAKDLLTAQSIRGANAAFRYDTQNSWSSAREEKQDMLVPPLGDLEVRIGAAGYEESGILEIPALRPGERHELIVSLRPLQLGCISGKVIDHFGAPVSGVTVSPGLETDYLNSQIGTRVTDENGRFKFERVHPGTYSIFTHAALLGYFPWPLGDIASVVVPPSSGCIDVTVNLGPKAARVDLKVVDALTQRPLKHYTAWVTGDPGTWVLNVHENPMPLPALKSLQVSAEAKGYGDAQSISVGPLQPEEMLRLTIELYPSAAIATKEQ